MMRLTKNHFSRFTMLVSVAAFVLLGGIWGWSHVRGIGIMRRESSIEWTREYYITTAMPYSEWDIDIQSDCLVIGLITDAGDYQVGSPNWKVLETPKVDFDWSMNLSLPRRYELPKRASLYGSWINLTAGDPRFTQLCIPLWIMCLIAALPGTIWAVRWKARQVKRRSKAGLCTKCGYDLRASGARCPECGEENVKPSQSTTWQAL